MITCSVCGCLNDPSNMVCEECWSDLIDESELEYLYDDLEFKEQEIDVHILAKHILGIANTSGGTICLGVKESDEGLIPIGLDNSMDSTDLKKKLSKYLPYNLDYEVHPIDYDDSEFWTDTRNIVFLKIN